MEPSESEKVKWYAIKVSITTNIVFMSHWHDTVDRLIEESPTYCFIDIPLKC